MNRQELNDIGIDMNVGLRNFKNNPLMYTRFLEQFIATDKHIEVATNAREASDDEEFNNTITEFSKLCKQFGLVDCSGLCDKVLEEGISSEAFSELSDKYAVIVKGFKG